MSRRLEAGIVGGLAGGVVFGALMHALGVIGMLGRLIGAEGVVGGWAVHVVASAAIGVGYAVIAGAFRPGYVASTVAGAAYGVVWWVLGPLLLLPLLLGMPAFPEIGQQQVNTLIGHVLYGLVLGFAYVAVRDRPLATARAESPERERQLQER